jgi:hypothetical protein
MISRASEALIPFRVRKLLRNTFLVKQVPKPRMDPEAREFLIRFYSVDVLRLADLLGRQLPWRNFGKETGSRNVG